MIRTTYSNLTQIRQSVLVAGLLLLTANCQTSKDNSIHTVDIDNFWKAYDTVIVESNSKKQIELMQELYIEKGTGGLKAFMEVRNYGATDLVESINKYPRFWESIRLNTLKVHNKKSELNQYVQNFKKLYPSFRDAQIYFTISPVRSGGTDKDSLVLIGTEIATGNSKTDVSEFPDKRLETFFKNQSDDNIIPFAIHEYVHTQQKTEGNSLLGQSIYEGVCDFVTELVLDTKLEHAYLDYGRKNESALKKQFFETMWSKDWSNWLYNGDNSNTVGDLGYFMGYAICQSFYEQSKNKETAIATMIELDYGDKDAISLFLEESKYYQ